MPLERIDAFCKGGAAVIKMLFDGVYTIEDVERLTGVKYIEFRTGSIVTVGDGRGFDYWVDMDYNQR